MKINRDGIIVPRLARTDTEQRDQTVIKRIAEGVAPSQALLEVGYAESVAKTKTSVVVESILKRSPMIAALDEIGVTTKACARMLKRGLRAKKVQRILVRNTVREFTDIDHGTRHRYLETALRLRGEDPDRQSTGTEETYEQRVRRLRSAGNAALEAKPPAGCIDAESIVEG